MDLKKELGPRLRKSIVKYYGRKQEHNFARLLGISQGSLSEVLNSISLPSATTLQKIGQRTQVSVTWLLGIKA